MYVCAKSELAKQIAFMPDATLVVAAGCSLPADVTTDFLASNRLFLIHDSRHLTTQRIAAVNIAIALTKRDLKDAEKVLSDAQEVVEKLEIEGAEGSGLVEAKDTLKNAISSVEVANKKSVAAEQDLKKPQAFVEGLAGEHHAAVYHPWLQADWARKKVNSSDVVGELQAIPPSAPIAGVYVTVDRERGVWKAPANVTLQGGLRAKERSGAAFIKEDIESRKAINLIQQPRDGAPLVWGSRTLASAAEASRWQYIPVRRHL